MVVLIVDKDRVLVFKGEGQPPIAADLDGPMTVQIAFQFVERPAGHIHIRLGLCIIEQLKPIGELLGMRWNDARLGARPVEPLYARNAGSS
jgi:hypothetical protein